MLSEPNDSDCTAKIQVLSKIIFGEPASKANSRRLVHFGGVSRLIKSKKALSYKDFDDHELPHILELIEWYKNNPC